MQKKFLGKIFGKQDGAIYNGYLFNLVNDGSCHVYRLDELSNSTPKVCKFILDKADIICPHSNCVSFGNEKYCEEDEFPILYSNIYNNYAKAEDKLKGVPCVYRIVRNGNEFSSVLVQLIEVAFTEDEIWKSQNDVRPYGNFVIDTEKLPLKKE